MRQQFIQAEDRTAAKKACPWAPRIIKVEGGFMCFESETDYQIWKTSAMTRLRRLTREGKRQLIEDMAIVLIGEIEIGNDQGCIMSLLARGFRPTDIFDCLDTARTIARAAIVDEAGLWERLMR